MTIRIWSEAFENGRPIPPRHAREGENVSPPLRFEDVPDEAREMVLIAYDPDTANHAPWVHWLVYGIPPDVRTVPEALATRRALHDPQGAKQGVNTSGLIGYDGPAPEPGDGTHRVHFKLYALDRELGVPGAADVTEVFGSMLDHVVDYGELVGTYER